MCKCFERDPAWQGWEAWYFGRDEGVDAALAPACDDERPVLAETLPEPALLH